MPIHRDEWHRRWDAMDAARRDRERQEAAEFAKTPEGRIAALEEELAKLRRAAALREQWEARQAAEARRRAERIAEIDAEVARLQYQGRCFLFIEDLLAEKARLVRGGD